MLALNLPEYPIKVKVIEGKRTIFDEIRRQYVALTPEEWVRQHFVHYLIHHKRYSKSLMGNEVLVNLNNQKKRCDTIVYNNRLEPLMIIEYKAPQVKITQDVFNQIYHYNIVLRANYLVVSNGLQHFCCEMDYEMQNYRFLNDIPDYLELKK
ncbi:MAG: type I restriction enzyme HsdR N-terminal domain-containing protein [Bacteroidales bacterium]|nr:type I restriction enzyme HsdR N-terminal domain-containing protein [Bacteroidales bacterium]